MTRDRDTFDAFQPRDRGRFGDNESTAIRSNDSVRSNLVDVTVFFIRETDKAIGIGRTTSVGPVVATDGHRIMVAWDSEGKCRKPTTIGLDRNLLNACKPSKHCREPRIHVDAQGYVDVIWGDASAVRSTKSCRVLGDFPDWRKCVPVKKWSMKPASFRGTYLGDFGKIANALAGIEHAAVRVLTDDECSAAIILFPYSNDRAFGVLMPMHVKVGPGGLPLWVKPVMDASKKRKALR